MCGSHPHTHISCQGCRSVEEFQCLNRIEEGTYGVVYRAKDKKTGEQILDPGCAVHVVYPRMAMSVVRFSWEPCGPAATSGPNIGGLDFWSVSAFSLWPSMFGGVGHTEPHTHPTLP